MAEITRIPAGLNITASVGDTLLVAVTVTKNGTPFDLSGWTLEAENAELTILDAEQGKLQLSFTADKPQTRAWSIRRALPQPKRLIAGFVVFTTTAGDSTADALTLQLEDGEDELTLEIFDPVQGLQPGDNVSELVNDAGYITAAEAPVQSVNGFTGDVSLTLDDILDVSVTSPNLNDLLNFDGSDWVLTDTPTVRGLQLDTTNPSDAETGRIIWNDGDQVPQFVSNGVTVDLSMEMLARCRNVTGSMIPKGTAVCIVGASAQRISIAPSDRTQPGSACRTLGVTLEEIQNNQFGKVSTFGLVRGLNTAGIDGEEGDELFVGATPGSLSTVPPEAPARRLIVGYLVTKNPNTGRIFVTIKRGVKVDEIDDVEIESITEGDVIRYDATAGRWENTGLGTAADADVGDFDPAGSAAGVQSNLQSHIDDSTNPHQVTAEQVGLGNVDDTSDLDKPISTATQAALDDKAHKTTQVIAGTGLDGGGDLSEDRTFNLDSATVASLGKADSALQSGDNVSELTNDAAYITLTDLSASGDLVYDNETGNFSVTTYKSADFNDDFAGKNTDNLSEGSANLYFTTARIDGHLSGGTGIDYSNGVISIDSATQSEIAAKANDADISIVGKTGSYNDLLNKPDLSVLEEVLTFPTLGDFPATGETGKVYIAEDTGFIYRWSGAEYVQLTDQTAIWGQISGTLSNQTDLQNALNAKANDADISVVGKTGNYADLTNTPINLSDFNNDENFIALTDLSASGDLSYNSSTGVFSFTERTDQEVRNLFSTSGDLSYNSATGVFSVTTYKSTDFDNDFATKDTGDLTEGTNLYFTTQRIDSHLTGGTGVDYSAGNISLDASTIASLGLADTALQAGDNITELTNDANYIDAAGAAAAAPVQSVNTKTGSVVLDKGDVGLVNVDNTSDADKPVSTATQSALDAKVDKVIEIIAGTGLNGGGDLSASRTIDLSSGTVASLELANTALQSGDNISELNNDANYIDVSGAPVQSVNTKTGNVVLDKSDVGLSNVDNVSASELRDRSTHTGTQAISTVAGLQNALDLKADDADISIVGKTGSYNDLLNKPDLSVLEEVLTFPTLGDFPTTGETGKVYIAENTGFIYRWSGTDYVQLTDQTAIWGQISGTLSNQTDLQNALNLKLEQVDINDFETSLELNDRDAANRNRLNHTGTQAISTVSNLQGELDSKASDADISAVGKSGNYNDLTNTPTIGNGALSMGTSGIATGSASFTANQTGGSTFTVDVPGTNLGSSGTGGTRTITSSTGNNTSITYTAADLGAVPTGRMLTAGDGLSGGGNLTANRTFAVDGTVVRNTTSQTINGNLTLSSNGFIRVPSGTTAQRPTPQAGMIRFNTTRGCFEGYNGNAWINMTPINFDDVGS